MKKDSIKYDWSKIPLKERLKTIISPVPSNWKKEFEYRQKNDYWLCISQQIAITILSELKKQKLTQKELTKKSKITEKKLTNIVKGKEDLKLSTILKLEKALNIRLIKLIYEYSFKNKN